MLRLRQLACFIPLLTTLALRAEDNEPNNYSYQPIEITGQKVVTWRDSIAGEQPLAHFVFLQGGNTVAADGPAIQHPPAPNFTPQYGWEIRESSVNGDAVHVDQIRIANVGNGRGWATVRVTKEQDFHSTQTGQTISTVLSTEFFTVYVGRGAEPPAVVAANLDPTFTRTDPDPTTGHYTQTDTHYDVEVDALTPNPAHDERDTFQIFWLPANADFSVTVSSQSFRPKVQTFDAFGFMIDEVTAAVVTDPVNGTPLPGGSTVIDGQATSSGAVFLLVTSSDNDSAGIYTFTFILLDAVSPSVTSSLGIPADAVRVWSDPLIGSANGTDNVNVGGATYITGTTTVSSPVSFDRLYLGSSIVASGAGGGIISSGGGGQIVAPGAGGGIVASGAGGGIVASGAGSGIVASGAGGGLVANAGIVASGAGGGIVAAGAGITSPLLNAYGIVAAGAGIVASGAGGGIVASGAGGGIIAPGAGGAMTGVGGLLQGIGGIFSSLVFQGVGASLVNPSSPPVPSGSFGIFGLGFSPGGLTVHGDVALLAGTQHEVEIAGRVPGAKYDFCEIKETLTGNGGHFILHGGPTLVIKLLDGFTPLPADTFTVVAADYPIVGSYGNAASGGRVSTHNNSGSFHINYGGANVILSDYQPNASSTYELWGAANFTPAELANALISGPNADPDGDGRVNLMEYAQDTPPKSADIAALPVLGAAGGAVQFDFERDTFPTDLVYHCESSCDLSRWLPEPASFLGAAGNVESWRAAAPVAEERKFFRLRLFKP